MSRTILYMDDGYKKELMRKYEIYIVRYKCSNCNNEFEEVFNKGEEAIEPIKCPICGTYNARKIVK